MRRTIAGLSLLVLGGCADFDAERFQQGLGAAYAFNQATVQPQVDALNAMSLAQAGRAQPVSLYNGPANDFVWAWDLQRAPNGQSIWVCRGVQTGQYSDPAHCAYKPQIDSQWPGY